MAGGSIIMLIILLLIILLPIILLICFRKSIKRFIIDIIREIKK